MMVGAVYENVSGPLVNWLPAVTFTIKFLLLPPPVIGGVTSSSKVSLFHTTLVYEKSPKVTTMVEEIGPKEEPVT